MDSVYLLLLSPYNATSLDVGGGSVNSTTAHALARIPLRWMIRETFKANTGIMFDGDRLRSIGLDPTTLHDTVLKRPPALTLEPGVDVAPPPPSGRSYASWWPTLLFTKPYAPPRQTVFTNLNGSGRVDVHDKDGALCQGTEEEEDLMDAMMPAHDQLQIHWAWRILERVPCWFRVQKEDNHWEWWFRCVGLVYMEQNC